LTEKQSPWFNRWHEDKATDCFRLLIKRKRRKKDISECFGKVLRNDEIPSFYHGEGERGKKVKVEDFSCEEEKNLRKHFLSSVSPSCELSFLCGVRNAPQKPALSAKQEFEFVVL
jgi:hypothetical protein